MSLKEHDTENETKKNDDEEATLIVDTENTIQSWDDLDCDTALLRGIYSYGFEKPSPIQQRAILPI